MTAQLLDLLSQQEVETLTGYQRPGDQARILQQHGIFYVERKDGSLAVTLHAVHNPVSPFKPQVKKSAINLDAINV